MIHGCVEDFFYPKIPDKQARVIFRKPFGSAQDNHSAIMQFDLI